MTLSDRDRQAIAAAAHAGRARASKLPPLSEAQFGAIIGGIKKVASPLIEGAVKLLEKEQQLIGRPIAKAIVAPLRPILPSGVERGLETVLAAILVPSTLIPMPGLRFATAGGLIARASLRGALKPGTIAQSAKLASRDIALLYKSQAKMSGLIAASTRTIASDPLIGKRRVAITNLRTQRTALRAELRELGEQTSSERVGEITKELTRVDKKLDRATRELFQLSKTRMDNLIRSPSAAIQSAADMNVEAQQTIARYNSGRALFWKKHSEMGTGELQAALKHLVQDVQGVAPAGLKGKKLKAWRETNAFIRNLMIEGPHDPLANPDGFLSFFAREWNPLRGVFRGVVQPIADLPGALSGKLISGQRIAMANAQTQRQIQHALELGFSAQFGEKAIKGEKVLLSAYKGPSTKALADDAAERLLREANEAGRPLTEQAEKELRDRLAREFDGVVGTVSHAVRRADDYVLSADEQAYFKFVTKTLTEDGLEVQALGGSIGFLDDAFYFPQRRTIGGGGAKQALGSFSRLGFARRFKERTIPDFNDFVARAAADHTGEGLATELRLSALLDWRLGLSARKKSEQMFMSLLANDPETARLVSRPLQIRARKKVGPELAAEITEEALEDNDLAASIAHALNTEIGDAEALAQQIRQVSPKVSNERIAEFFLGSERTITPAGKLPTEMQEMGRYVEDMLGGRLAKEAMPEEGIGGVVDSFRNLFLSMDLSPYAFVQGARMFAQDPVVYLRQIASAASWNMTDSGRRIWTLQNAPALRFWAGNGLQMGHPLDIVLPAGREAGDVGVSLAKQWAGEAKQGFLVPGVATLNREMMHMVAGAKLHLANTTYATMLIAQSDTGVRGLLKGLPWFDEIANKNKNWEKMPGDTLARAVSEGLNNYVGPLEVMRIKPGNRFSTFERLFLLTPSWTRGNIGAISNAFKLGNKGIVARHLYMNQLALQTMMATKLSLAATGRTPSLDPRSNDFLAVQLPWGRVHLMPAMPVMRLPARILAGRPEAEIFKEENIFVSRGKELTRFFEGRIGQMPRVIIDLASGEDFIGRTVEPSVKHFLTQAAPIAIQEIAETLQEGNIPRSEIIQRATLAGLGASNIPKTPMRQYREQVELITGEPFADDSGERTFTRQQLKKLESENPQLVALQERAREYRKARADPITLFFEEDRQINDKLQEQMRLFLESNAERVGSIEFLVTYGEFAQGLLRERAEFRSNVAEFLDLENKVIGKEKPNALDQVAFDYWALDPEDFVDLEGITRSINDAFFAGDADAVEQVQDETWRAYQRKRESFLTTDEERRYVQQEFPKGRWDSPLAQTLEVRRVAAQGALTRYFDLPRYRWPTQEVFTLEEERELGTIRDHRDSLLGRLVQNYRAAFDAGLIPNPDLPGGTTERLLRAMLAQERDGERRRLIAWEILWQKERTREGFALRNPARDIQLVRNPDAIRFFHFRLWRPPIQPPRRLLSTPLGQDPEIANVLSGAR